MTSVIIIQEYLTREQRSPFGEWFSGLSTPAALKVRTALARMESGNTSNIKWFSGLGEYRIDWGPGYRIYLIQEGDRLIILLGGGTKSSQTTDIKRARTLAADYKAARKQSHERGTQWP